jgi:hypothetical protein
MHGVPQFGIVGRTIAKFRPRLHGHGAVQATAPTRQRGELATGSGTITGRKTVCRVVDRHGTPQLPSLSCGAAIGGVLPSGGDHLVELSTERSSFATFGSVTESTLYIAMSCRVIVRYLRG